MVSTSLLFPLFLLFLFTPSTAAPAAANLQTFFPSLPSPAISAQPPPPFPPPPPPPPPFPPPPPHPPAKESDAKVIKAVAATAASSFALSGLLFFAFYRFGAFDRRQEPPRPPPSSAKTPKRNASAFDPNGLDAVYLREFHPGRCDNCNGRLHPYAKRDDDSEGDLGSDVHAEDAASSPPSRNYGRRVQESPLLPAGSISSSSEIFSESFRSGSLPSGKFSVASMDAAPNPLSPLTRERSASSRPPLPPSWSSQLSMTASNSSPVPPSASRSTSTSISALQLPPQMLATKSNAAPSPPAPPSSAMNWNAATSMKRNAAPSHPAPPSPAMKTKAAPPPPPSNAATSMKRNAAPSPPAPPSPAMKTKAAPPPPPPPPPPVQKTLNSNAAPPPPPPPPVNRNGKATAAPPQPPAIGSRPAPSLPPPPWAAAGEGGGKKLKPLHWDKLNTHNVEHSMVWDKITDSSFRFEFDEGVMVELFGTNKGTPHNKPTTSTSSMAVGRSPAKVSLLDPRKSQNMAIVLRSLALSRQSVVDALRDGRGLGAETLEKLTKVAPTKEEEVLVRDYAGDPSELADAEAFLFHVLRAVPSPFARVGFMLFTFNYDAEMAHLNRSLHTLDLACKELKFRPGLFLKLLEVILKAGNLMNAGTARGNAEAFDLTALCRLSDVKSTDGSTTLLHFVVQEVLRSEGKRLAQVDRNNSTRKSGNLAGPAGANLQRSSSRAAREEREKEYIKLGQPIVGGLSDQFANLKMAAEIDYDAVAGACSALGARIAELKQFLVTCGGDGFAREMKGFVRRAEEELRAARTEQERVLLLVKRTIQYYQAGGGPSKNKGGDPLQLFRIVKDFLGMVDKACVDILRDLQKRKKPVALPPPSTVTTAAEAAAPPVSSSKSSPSAPTSRRTRPAVRFPHLPVHFISKSDTSSSSSDDEEE